MKFGVESMGDLGRLKGEKIHTRNIEMNTWEVDRDHILVEGRLVDIRCRDFINLSGEKRKGGELHHMAVRCLIKIPELEISDIETDMVTIPREDCRGIHDSLDALKGERLVKGFTRRVRELLGGPRGCTHLNHLIVTMASAAMQGFFALNASWKDSPDRESREKFRLKTMELFLSDTCYCWRENGPEITQLRERLKLIEK